MSFAKKLGLCHKLKFLIPISLAPGGLILEVNYLRSTLFYKEVRVCCKDSIPFTFKQRSRMFGTFGWYLKVYKTVINIVITPISWKPEPTCI